MKLAIVHPSLAVRGGAEHVVVWLAAELARRGHEVTVVTTAYDAPFFGAPETHGFHLVTGDFGGYEVHPVMHIRAGWRLRSVLGGFDWVNPHNFPAYHWAFWARVFNRAVGRIVWFCEEPMRWFYPEICNPHLLELRRRDESLTPAPRPRPWGVRQAAYLRGLWRHWRRHWPWETSRLLDVRIVPRLDLILANSEFIAAQVRTIFGAPASACLLGIPPDRFACWSSSGGPPIPGRYILTVSRLHPEKNLETVMNAVALLRARGSLPFDRYVVAGDGPIRNALRAQADRLGLSDVVTFLGFVDDAALAQLYRHAAVVVYLPLDETYGLVFPEAGLWRKAVIGPNHGGPREIIHHGETGLQVDPLDPAAVAAAIDRCLRQPELSEQMGNAGYRLATTDLSLPRFVDRFEQRLAAQQERGP